MICPHCKSDTEPRVHSRFVYQHQVCEVADQDLEVVLGSCPQCQAPVVLLRRGRSTEMDGLVEMTDVLSEEVLYPSG